MISSSSGSVINGDAINDEAKAGTGRAESVM
jgi:hypothetical protein